MFQRIDVGDSKRIGNETPRGGATAWSDGNPLFAREADEIPDDEKVASESHLPDDFDLPLEPGLVIGDRDAELSVTVTLLDPLHPLTEPLPNDLFEVTFDALSFRYFELREVEAIALQVQADPFRDGQCVVIGFLVTVEDLGHLFGGLEVELLSAVAHPIRVGDLLAGPDTEQNVVGHGVFAAYVMTVVGRDGRQTRLPCQGHQPRIHDHFFFESLVLDLEEEITLTQDIFVCPGRLEHRILGAPERGGRHFPFETCGEPDETFRVRREELLVDSRLVVEPFEVAGGNQLHEIRVALVTFRQQDQVVIGIGNTAPGGPVEATTRRDVDLTAQNRFHAFFLCRLKKGDGAEHVPMIGERYRGHLVLRGEIHDLVNATGPVEQ